MRGLTERVKNLAIELGADLVGVSPIDRFKNAPLRMSPQGLLPGARSVVVAAIHHPDACIELDGEPTAHEMGPYGLQSSVMNPRLDDISFLLARFLEDEGHVALPIAASNIWRYTGYKDLKVDFAPDMAHRYAAVAAGLAEIGWSGLAISPEFGPRQRWVSVVTEADLIATPMYTGEPLCDKCMACVNNCPVDAFRKEVRKINEIEIGGRTFKFPDTNKWRCAWAEHFGLNLAHDIPEHIDEAVIEHYLEKYGRHKGTFGYCLKFCMVPERRYYESSYARGPRRHKEKSDMTASELVRNIEEICRTRLIDVLAIGSAADLKDDPAIHLEYHLPNATTAICLGLRELPFTADNAEVRTSVVRRLNYTAFKVTHFLDKAGYAATTGTKIADNTVAERLGIYQPGMRFITVLTDADLVDSKQSKSLKPKAVSAPEELRQLGGELGADLVGFFNKDRYQEFLDSLNALDVLPQEIEEVMDIGGINTPWVPEVSKRALEVNTLEKWLPGAKSVIVLGLHFAHSALDTAKVTPAETVGPYAFVQYESLLLLADMAYEMIKHLRAAGHEATFTFDLTGLASKTTNSRGMLPDMRANLFAAVLGGLAYPGLNGHPITEPYGVRQRFIAIVTDLELPNDPLKVLSICDDCEKVCLGACPTKALSGKAKHLTVENTSIPFPVFDTFACDWAKRYSLNGEEGPKYWGIEESYPVPDNKSADEIVKVVSRTEWGTQKLHLNVAEECLRVCPARGNK